jgi:hypothetical protein
LEKSEPPVTIRAQVRISLLYSRFEAPGHQALSGRRTRQSKSVIFFIPLKFHFFWKALNIKMLPELILHGIQIANTYNGKIEILKSCFR